MKLLLSVVLVVVLASCANASAPYRRAMQTMDTFSLQTFTNLFRQTLLNKIALEMNNTVDMTKELKIKMDACKVKVNTMTEQCKTCAKSTCQTDPTALDYLKAAIDMVDPFNYLKGSLDGIAGGLGEVVGLLGDQAAGFLNSIKSLGGSAVDGLQDGFTSALGALTDEINKIGAGILSAGNTIIDTANLIGDGFTDLGNSIGGGATDLGHELEHLGGSIGHALGGIFGRKKRVVDTRTRLCMEKCDSCRPLLLPTQNEVVSAVCGADIITLNNTIQARALKLQNVYNALKDTTHPIISKLEFDPASMDGQMVLTNVHVTVQLNGHVASYKTAVPYSMMNMPTSALNMAMEYWGKVQ